MQKISDIAEDGIMFYDIETNSQYCQYCGIQLMAYQVGLNTEPMLVEDWNREDFRKLLRSDIMKVSFNGINFDDVVLARHGYYVNPTNRHDMFLAVKTVAPMLPAFGLKFINWHYLGDWHEPQRLLHNWCIRNEKMMWQAPKKLLGNYCKHDVTQTCRVFQLVWEVVQRELHWKTYIELELAMGEPLHEMTLYGGEYIDIEKVEAERVEREQEIARDSVEIERLTGGKIQNPRSAKQVQDFFGVAHAHKLFLLGYDGVQIRRPKDNIRGLGFAGELDAALREGIEEGEVVKSKDPIKDRVKQLIRNVRDNAKVIGYLKSYREAALYERDNREIRDRNFFVRSAVKSSSANGLVKIPKSYSLSGAVTRRFISSSKFGINFQNQNKKTKKAQIVPKGWLGVFIDSTQIENVVHIWASRDDKRRKAYEADVNWNEYIWLCNQVLGTHYGKSDLEEMASATNPEWSVYKQYKTAKLALNFGMGANKFATMFGIKIGEASKIFAEIHRACPAIHQLQDRVKRQLIYEGRVRDPFGHIYTGSVNKAYKVVSYLVQGCGTGSVPKAMTIACYNTIHEKDTRDRQSRYQIYHPYRKVYMFGVLCGTTHDELSLRISLALPTEEIVQLIKDLMYNMEGRFRDRFTWDEDDVGIELRAKLAVSITTAADQVELDHLAPNFESKLVSDYIEVGKARDL